MHCGDMRIGHVRDEADAGRKKAPVFAGAWKAFREFGRELSANGRDVDPDFLENLAGHLPANAATAGFAARVGAIPRAEVKGGLASGFALDFLERRADPVAEQFKPVARCLLLVVERCHGLPMRSAAF